MWAIEYGKFHILHTQRWDRELTQNDNLEVRGLFSKFLIR